MKTQPLLLVILVFCANFIGAQENSDLSKAYQLFDNTIGQENTKLYNGKRYYTIYKSSIENHNFFKVPNFQKSNVKYDGDTFFNVDLRYDLFNDKLIYRPIGEKSFVHIELIQDKVSDFQINNHQFINSKNISNNKGLVSGYLEIIYTSATITLYAKRKKTVAERIRKDKLVYLFSNEPSFYILYNNQLRKIGSKKTYRKIFPEYAKEIKTEINENRKRFNDNEEGLNLYLAQWIDFKLTTNNAK